MAARRLDEQEVVGTRELLEHLQRDTDEDTIGHPRGAEHVDKLGNGIALDRLFCPQLGFNLLHLRMDSPMVWCRTVDAAEGVAGAVDMALPVVESRRLGEEQDANAEHQSEYPAQANDDAPRS